jgi:hypothetical protein
VAILVNQLTDAAGNVTWTSDAIAPGVRFMWSPLDQEFSRQQDGQPVFKSFNMKAATLAQAREIACKFWGVDDPDIASG